MRWLLSHRGHSIVTVGVECPRCAPITRASVATGDGVRASEDHPWLARTMYDYAAGWTDRNNADSGITMLGMLAMLAFRGAGSSGSTTSASISIGSASVDAPCLLLAASMDLLIWAPCLCRGRNANVAQLYGLRYGTVSSLTT